ENGQFGAMARPVREAYERKTELVNRQTTLYTRGEMPADADKVRAKTEAMQTLIGGYNRLRKGDAVLYADLDYDSMQTSMEGLARTRGVRVVKINLPEPATRQDLI